MDKTTKGFVIAACSVIIATPVIWFIGAWIEDSRQVSRFEPCKERSMIHWPELSGEVLFSMGIEEVNERIRRNVDWVSECAKSNKPVDLVAFPSY